ncbi:Cobyrinic acid a,c-diamide synthase OS=Streptomyces alboniger OX=132473 GN=CP975_07340 PE=4 SV=1 [Streptomyces alboniger]
MSRRVSLPGADELFRTTGGTALQPSAPRRPVNGEARVPAPAGESDGAAATGTPSSSEDAPQSVPAQGGDGDGAEHVAADSEPSGAGESRSRGADPSGRRQATQEGSASGANGAAPRGKRGRAPSRRPSGRERHDEKITVYVSAEELMDLEHARLVLRGEHGLAVDRGRIVREAVAVVLADLESRGDASILVRRLRGR